MHYLVELETRLPPDLPQAEREALLAREAQRGARLRDDGVIVGIWRLPGRLANVAIWDAPDAGALHDALSSQPAWPWMTVTVTALARTRSYRTHPSARHSGRSTPQREASRFQCATSEHVAHGQWVRRRGRPHRHLPGARRRVAPVNRRRAVGCLSRPSEKVPRSCRSMAVPVRPRGERVRERPDNQGEKP